MVLRGYSDWRVLSMITRRQNSCSTVILNTLRSMNVRITCDAHEHCAVFSHTLTPHVHLIQRSECFSLWHVDSCTRTYRHQRIIHNSFTMNSIQVSILWYATRSYRSRGPSCCHNRYPCCSRRRNICCVHTHGNHISWFSWCKWHDVVYSVILVGNLLADVLYLQQVVCFLLWTAFSAVKRCVRIRVHVHRVYVRWAYRARQFSVQLHNSHGSVLSNSFIYCLVQFALFTYM